MDKVLFVIGAIFLLSIPVGLFLLNFFLKRKARKEWTAKLKELSLESLEKNVYRYETEYFKIIGEDNASVVEFWKLIENKDISTLNKKCRGFMETFVKLERKAGHNSRPMLVDYYFGYELYVEELYKRQFAEL